MLENREPGLIRRSQHLQLICAFLLLSLSTGAGRPGQGTTVKPQAAKAKSMRADAWKEVERLVQEQKFEAALGAIGRIRQDAQKAGRQEEWAKALTRETGLRLALHGHETAVRFLREQAWPRTTLERAAVQLYYAHALVEYQRAYSWEIGRREKVGTALPAELKQWTRDQIFEEAARAFEEVWKQRAALGREPVSRFGEYIERNNYPESIRGTLRDTVSYLYIGFLADSAFWRPEDSAEVYRLKLTELLRTPVPEPGAGAHPLFRIAYVTGDLESWHAAGRRPEAELEACLERLRRLSEHYSEPADQRLILSALEKRLADLRELPWWSMGMAEMAVMLQRDSDASALIKARAAAREGYEAHREAPGGRRCLNILRSIEAPDFRLGAMKVDGRQRRSIEITHKNLGALHFRAYSDSPERRLRSLSGAGRSAERQDLEKTLTAQKPVVSWSAELPGTPDYRMHRTFITPPLKEPGCYRIVVSARSDFSQGGENRIHAVDFILSDFVLQTLNLPGDSLEARVLDGNSGEPVPDVTISLHRVDWQSGPQFVREERTSQEGRARFPLTAEARRNSWCLLAQLGGNIALDTAYYYGTEPVGDVPVTSSLVYTDRSVYRPGQRIYWKVLAYQTVQGRGQPVIAPGAQVTVTLTDPNGEKVEERRATTNSFGTTAGEFSIPTGRLLGSWRIQTSLRGSAAVRVEEYKRPTFEVTLKESVAPMRLNKPAAIPGDARYYFGLPLTSGVVRWRVSREPVYPWWWGWHEEAPDTRSRTIAAGSSAIGSDGTFQISFTPEADERQASNAVGISYRYRVNADVTDEGGETRTATRTFRLGFVSLQARFDSDVAFFLENTAASFAVARTDLNGAPRAGAASYRVAALAQPETAVLPADFPTPRGTGEEFQTAGDRLRPRWKPTVGYREMLRSWPDSGEVAAGSLQHGGNGLAELSLPALAAGAYRIHYETRDDFGEMLRETHEFIVAGPRMFLALPFVMLLEKSVVEPGRTVRLLAHSGLKAQPLSLEIWRDGRLVTNRLLRAGREPALVELFVREEDRGGFSLRLSALHDYQFFTESALVSVPWENKRLKLDFSTFRDKLRPGAVESWRVTVGNREGGAAEAGAAEVLAYMYDRSLDIFAPHNPPGPLSLFWRPTTIERLTVSLGTAEIHWVVDRYARVPDAPEFRGDRLRLYPGAGIGGPGRRFAAGIAGGVVGGVTGGVVSRAPEAAPVAMMQAAPEMPMAKAAVADRVEAAGAGGGELPEPPPILRTDFSETAFWQPQLLTNPDGTVTIEFKVPDSVTSWNFWVHAITRDLKSASERREVITAKELMVRPYLPRFLREGDRASLKVLVNNASDRALEGRLSLDILDPESNQSVLARFGLKPEDGSRGFRAPQGGSAAITFAIVTPAEVGAVAFKVTAVSGDFSDGELRPLPILPGRMHLMQTRFTTLRDKDRRELVFADLEKGGDPTRQNEKMVVSVDAQLFYSALAALPYLVDFPYECTEQLLNRFVSTGILTGMFQKYPAVARMAQDLSKRETRLETWDALDPNRKMALEETPWGAEAGGGEKTEFPLSRVLDPRVARAEAASSLAKLRKAQQSSGAFPWWPGGPPSPHMTLYILYGFAKAAEFGVDVPRDVVQRGWSYLAEYHRQELRRRKVTDDCCWEFATFLNYVASCYPDPSWMGNALTPEERRAALDNSFRNWRKHSPYLKCMLALTLRRMNRLQDARLVFSSVMDSARTTGDEGTFWAPEDRSWLWYNDTIESHAMALRAMMEISPEDKRQDGLVQWLFLNKKLNHWKSTRATAEVIYSLARYLQKQGTLGAREEVMVRIGGQESRHVFEPDRYTGRASRTVVPGTIIDPASARIVVQKETPGLVFASATWHFSTEQLPAQASGDFLSVTRSYYRRENTGGRFVLLPIAAEEKIRVGDEVEVQLSIRAKHACEYVHLRDPRAAGMEPVSATSRYRWDMGISWYEEIRDSGTNFFFENLPAGEYTFKYRLRASMAGTFRVSAATLQSMYAPEFSAYSTGAVLVLSETPR